MTHVSFKAVAKTAAPIVLLLVIAGGIFYGIKVYLDNQFLPTYTDCFQVDLPKKFKVGILSSQRCSLTATLGPIKPADQSSSFVVIAPKSAQYGTAEGAFAQVQNDPKAKQVTIGGQPAYQIDQERKTSNNLPKLSREVTVFTAKIYERPGDPPNKVKTFFISISVPPGRTDLLDRITGSIVWK